MHDMNYFDAMTNTSQNLNLSYGYLWWLNGKASYMMPGSQIVFPGSLMPNAPADMFSALGKNCQYLNIVPSKGIVLVRMGNDPDGIVGLVPTVLDNEIWRRLNLIMCDNPLSNQAEKTNQIQVFPNPSATHFQVQLAPTEHLQLLELLDLQGRSIAQTAQSFIAVDACANGMYVLRVRTDKGIHLQKVQIAK